MQIAYLTASFHLPGCSSLKEKRQRISGLNQKLGRHPYIALCETDQRDDHSHSEWSLIVIGRCRKDVDQRLSEAERQLQKLDATLLELQREWL